MDERTLFLSLYFPAWSVNLAQRNPLLGSDVPLLLTTTVAQQLIIKRLCSKAREAGVKEEMSLVLAKAMIPNAHIASYDPLKDFKALYKLALWNLRITPLVGLDRELSIAFKNRTLDEASSLYNGIILDLTGTEKLYKDHVRLANRILQKLSEHGFQAKGALAPTLGGAWALSRYAASSLTCTNASSLKEALLHLPIQALRISTESTQALFEVGVFFIKDLLELPQKKLAIRFGKNLLLRIDQALGRVDEKLIAVYCSEKFEVKRDFEIPLSSSNALQTIIHHLLKEVFVKLALHKKRARAFVLTLEVIRGDRKDTLTKEFSLYTATNDLFHFTSIIQPVIESLSCEGEIYSAKITAKSIETNTSQQSKLLQSIDTVLPPHIIEELINNFVIRLGKDKINTVGLNQSYIPEKSFSFLPLVHTSSKSSIVSVSTNQSCYPLYRATERPSYIFPQPELVTTIAMLPDKPPSWLQWRGRKYKIISGIGPESLDF